MKSWIRQVVPTAGLLPLAISVYLTFTFFPYLVFRLSDGGNPPESIFEGGLVAVSVAALLFGGYRVFFFHPLCNKEYREWLRNSPWTADKPLLGGPLNLVLQDVVIVGVMTALCLVHGVEYPLLIPELFIVMHVLFCGVCFLMNRQWAHAYALAFTLSGLMYFWNVPLLLGVVLLLLVMIARHGIGHSLKSFRDWDLDWFESTVFLQTNTERAKELQRSRMLGWPHDQLGPRRSEFQIKLGWSFAISVLAGWWTFSPLALFLPAGVPSVVLFNPLIVAMVGVRLYYYLRGYSPPLSLWGRFRTGRWIIPGYDFVFLAPLAVLFLSGAAAYCIEELFYPIDIIMGLLSFSTLLITLSGRPSLDEWKLTGNHRIGPGLGLQTQELQQTQ